MKKLILKVSAITMAFLLLLPSVVVAGNGQYKEQKKELKREQKEERKREQKEERKREQERKEEKQKSKRSKPKKIAHISLNKKSIVLEVGDTEQLVAKVSPADATCSTILWGSTDEDVAAVTQQGKVTAKDEGTAYVYAIARDGYKIAFCKVVVIEEPVDDEESDEDEDDSDEVAPRELTLNLVQTVLPVGSNDIIRYSVEPTEADNKEVRWSSSNTRVATVNSAGKVTAVAVGNATITAKAIEGNIQATCLISVIPAEDPPTNGVILNKETSIIKEGEKDYPVATVYPTNLDTELTWSSSDTSIATVNSRGHVTAVDEGTVVITVRTSENKRASYTVVVI